MYNFTCAYPIDSYYWCITYFIFTADIMDDQNGKCGSTYPRLDDGGVKKIDLTLKLGPSVNYNQNQEEDNIPTCRGAQGFSVAASQSSNDVVL